jgi:hypothetical protein
MNLHREDIISFEQNSSNKVSEYRTFSFDLNKVVKQIGDENNSVNESSCEEKDKIIIKEPLEVFELENEHKHHAGEYSSDEKDSRKLNDSQDDDEKILKGYDNDHGILPQSRNENYGKNLLMSPKFQSFENHLESNEYIEVSANHDSRQRIESQKFDNRDSQISVKRLEMSNESSNQRDIREKNRMNSNSQFKRSPEAKELDYKEQLRRSLALGSKQQSSVKINKSEKDEAEEHSDQNILSPDGSDNDSAMNTPPEYLMSPFHDKFENFDEYRKIVKEYANKIGGNLQDDEESEEEDENKQHSESLVSINMSNHELDFDAQVSNPIINN